MARYISKFTVMFVILCTFGFFFLDFYGKSKFLDSCTTKKVHARQFLASKSEVELTQDEKNNLSEEIERKKEIERKITIVRAEAEHLAKSRQKQLVQSRWGRYNRYGVWNEHMSSKDILPRLQVVKKSYQSMNKYKVKFQGKPGQLCTPQELLCAIKNKVNMSTLVRADLPQNASSWSQYLPIKTLQEEIKSLGKCAVVSSAGSIKYSSLGQEIDAHDAVLRFNAAPTRGHQDDVGTKTTFRLLNSQLVSRPELKFFEDPLYKEGTLLMWDPSQYQADLDQWHRNPDYMFFERYSTYRRKNPDQMFYVLNPQAAWQLWDIIQQNSPEDIHPGPPSSGFLGILLMMNLCNQVDVYEFLPSRRQTDFCHYYEIYQDRACTLGAYHPLMYEKNLVKKLNLGDDNSIYHFGKVTVPGLRGLQC
ncbi:beta-galactoside alpha-2,6-sialyltransferase 1 isoform X2 [Xenopus laevis]|nr:beta-galactoside alpha-2,6-sialyltransferase 1 isoform X2 [Xenopus laevis]OCT78833.1 hypothetical protein XELAEV_18029923mg [Xenopus laevis]